MARIKRYSVRVRANDPVSFKRAVGQRLYLDGMRMPTTSRTKVNTPVEVLLSYEDGREALHGTGSVSSCADNEVILKLSWKEDEPGLHEYLFASSQKYLEPVSNTSRQNESLDSSDCTLMMDLATDNPGLPQTDEDNGHLRSSSFHSTNEASDNEDWGQGDQSADDLASLVWDYGDDSLPQSAVNHLSTEHLPAQMPSSSLAGDDDDLLGAFELAQAALQSLEGKESELIPVVSPGSSQSITHVKLQQLEPDLSNDDLIPVSKLDEIENTVATGDGILGAPTLGVDLDLGIRADAEEVTAEHSLIPLHDPESFEIDSSVSVETNSFRSGGTVQKMPATLVNAHHFDDEDVGTDNTERLSPLVGASLPEPERLPNPSVPPLLGPPTGPILAIDLGTSQTCATLALGDGISPVHFVESEVNTGMPSVVVIDPAGKLLVGDRGVRYIDKHPDGVVVGVKRLVGRSYWSPAIRRVRDQLGWKVEPAADGSVTAHVGREVTSLEALTGALYRHASNQASHHFGRTINRAMLSCPVYFGHRQRSALAQAGRLAGLHVERIISSNLAILAYYYNGYAPKKERVLVIDMGAGTFEVAMAEVEGSRFSTLVSGGHPFLGGIEFDACVGQLVVAALDRRGSAPKLTRSALAGMLRVAEFGKRALGEQSEIELQLDTRVHIGSSPMKVNLFRQEAEGLWDGIMDKALGIIRDVCRRASMRHEDVDRIILVGGQTHAPYVRRRLKSFFRRELSIINDPQAVASGTAIIARASDSGQPLNLEETLPASLRLVSSSGHVLASVKRDVPLPMENECLVRLPSSERTILVYEGDHNNLQSCEPLGRVVFDDLPADLELNVRLQVGTDTRLSTQVRHRGSNIEIPSRFEAVVTSDDFLIPVAITPHTGDLDGGFLHWLGHKLPSLTST